MASTGSVSEAIEAETWEKQFEKWWLVWNPKLPPSSNETLWFTLRPFTESRIDKDTGERGRVSAPREALGALTRPRSPGSGIFDAGLGGPRFYTLEEVMVQG